MLILQLNSENLLDATLDMDGEAVAEEIEKIHNEHVSVIQYNNENSLSSVLTIAYLSAMQYYFKPIREFPTGRGFADFVFIQSLTYCNSTAGKSPAQFILTRDLIILLIKSLADLFFNFIFNYFIF